MEMEDKKMMKNKVNSNPNKIFKIQLNVGFIGTVKALKYLLSLPPYFQIADDKSVLHRDDLVYLNQGDEITVINPFLE